jgi:hypothetical protein
MTQLLNASEFSATENHSCENALGQNQEDTTNSATKPKPAGHRDHFSQMPRPRDVTRI